MLRPSTLVSALALVTSTYAQSSAQQAQEEVVSVLAIGTAGDQQNLFASVVDNVRQTLSLHMTPTHFLSGARVSITQTNSTSFTATTQQLPFSKSHSSCSFD